MKRRSIKSGLPPGSIVHVGDRVLQALQARVITYAPETFCEEAVRMEDALRKPPDEGVAWVRLQGVHDVQAIQALKGHLGIHDLVLEDIANTDQRPKLESFESFDYVVLKLIDWQNGTIVEEQVSLIVADRLLLSAEEGVCPQLLDEVCERIRAGRGRIRKESADYLACALIDAIVDRYFTVLEKVGEAMETLEDGVLKNVAHENLEDIHRWKRHLHQFRRLVWPLREVVNQMEHGDHSSPEVGLFLRDIHGHVLQAVETIEMLRETLAGILDLHMSGIGNRTNEVMKTLTIFAAIFIPLTFVVGLYGMNFQYMPELESRWGYPAVLVSMVLIAAGIVGYFRRKKWL